LHGYELGRGEGWVGGGAEAPRFEVQGQRQDQLPRRGPRGDGSTVRRIASMIRSAGRAPPGSPPAPVAASPATPGAPLPAPLSASFTALVIAAGGAIAPPSPSPF